jgi:hypothetical protein
MAETKYGKYFLNELDPEVREKTLGRMAGVVAFTDKDVIEGSQYLSVRFMSRASTPQFLGHGPHSHKDPEVLVALGTDPDNPNDLGAEFELCMGPEMEKHIVNTSTLIYIPPNFIHCPFIIHRLDRPFLFVHIQYAPKMTEKSYKKMVAEELRDKMIFINTDEADKEE